MDHMADDNFDLESPLGRNARLAYETFSRGQTYPWHQLPRPEQVKWAEVILAIFRFMDKDSALLRIEYKIDQLIRENTRMLTAIEQLQAADAAETAALATVAQALTDEESRVNALIEKLQSGSSDDTAIAAVVADLQAHSKNLSTIASTLEGFQEVVLPASTTVLSTASPTVTAGTDVPLTINVTGTAGAPPTGTVEIFDGETEVGTASLDSTGAATFSIPSIAVGAHDLTAAYSGDAANAVSTSSIVTVTAA